MKLENVKMPMPASRANIVASQPLGQSWDMSSMLGNQAISMTTICTASEARTKNLSLMPSLESCVEAVKT